MPLQDLDMTGHVAIVTGVTEGVGRAVVEVLAGYGARVVGLARRAEAGEELEAAVRERGSGSFIFVQGNVARAQDCEHAVAVCLERHGRIDSLINNAGITGSPDLGPVSTTTEETWDRVNDINLRGAFLMSRAVLPAMQQQRDGVILMVASQCAYWGLEGLGAYSASKAGLVGLSNTIAVEGFSQGIRCNAIILGGTDTSAASGANAAVRAKAANPGERKTSHLMRPGDVAQSLAALCLPQARMITGAAINLDQAMIAGRAMSNLLRMRSGAEPN